MCTDCVAEPSDLSLSCWCLLFRLCVKMCFEKCQLSHLSPISLCNPIKPKCNRNVKLSSVSRCDRRCNCIYSKYWDKQCFNNLYLSREGFCWACNLSKHIHTVTHTLTPGSCHTQQQTAARTVLQPAELLSWSKYNVQGTFGQTVQ